MKKRELKARIAELEQRVAELERALETRRTNTITNIPYRIPDTITWPVKPNDLGYLPYGQPITTATPRPISDYTVWCGN